jgi:hypothetical protein
LTGAALVIESRQVVTTGPRYVLRDVDGSRPSEMRQLDYTPRRSMSGCALQRTS